MLTSLVRCTEERKKKLNIFAIYALGTGHMLGVDGFACDGFTVSSSHMNRTRSWAMQEELTSQYIDSKSGTLTVRVRIFVNTTTMMDLCFIFAKRFGLLAGFGFRRAL